MAIVFTCECGKRLQVAEQSRGKKVQCPNCRAITPVATTAPAKSLAPASVASVTPERFQRIQQVLEQALDLPQAARAGFLNEACGNDADLRSSVESLLAHEEQMPSDFLAKPVLADAGNRPTVTYETPPLDGTTPKPVGERSEPAEFPTIPGYEIHAELGHGGMGVVYKAKQIKLGRIVALKMILAGGRPSKEELARFRTEAEAVARLQHPAIVQIHETDVHDGLPYFSMEYVAGGSLDRKLQGAPLPPADASRLTELLAQAMEAAHQKNILHRDLKPANVFLMPTEEAAGVPIEDRAGKSARYFPKIGDFGLAKKLEPADAAALTHSGAVMGTPSFMAPEQASGDGSAMKPAVDVYALGAILYDLLTGRPPFRAATVHETLQQVIHQDPVPPSRLNAATPRDLETICLKCLQKEPQRRYASARHLAEDLERYSNGEPIVARPVGQLERAVKWVKRNKATAAFLAAMVLLVFGGSAAGLWYQHDQARQTQEQLVRHGIAEEQVRESLARARTARDELHMTLKKPGGVQELLNRPERWQFQIKSARADWQRAKDHASEASDPQWTTLLNAQDEELARDQADHDLALRLEKIRLDQAVWVEGKFNYAQTEREYARAFQDADLAIAPGRKRAVAALIQLSAIKEQLLAALDDWAYVSNSKNANLTSQLLELARLSDPDPWRDRVRNPALWKNSAAMVILVEEVQGDQQLMARLSPQMLNLVSPLLPRANQEKWLRQAQTLHPADFWINFNLAWVLNDKKDPLEAAGFYRVALALRPNNAAVYNNLGGALHDQKDLPAAIAAYKKALDIEPKFAGAWSNLGTALHDQKDLPAAIDAFKKALVIDPKLAPAWTNLGSALVNKKDFPAAVDACKKALEIDPKLAPAWTNLGNALCEQKDLPAAIDACKKALEIEPKFATAWTGLGNALYLQKDLPAAIDAYKKALAIEPQDALAWNILGKALVEQKDWPAAVGAFKKALESDPKLALAWNNLGGAMAAQKDLPAAIIAVKKAIDIDPKDAKAWNNLGTALHDQKDLPAAIDAYKKALDIDPKDAKAWNNLGTALHDQKDLPAAIDAYKKALAIEPKDAKAWNNLGTALHDQKDLPAATDAFKKAVASEPKYANAWNNLGAVLHAQKDLPAAIDAFRKALEIEPKNANAWYSLGIVLRDQKDLPAAIIAVKKAIDIDPKDAKAWNNLGTALHDQKDLPAAVEAFKKALDIDPKYADAWYHLGNALAAMKDPAAAVDAYRKAVDIDPKFAVAWNHLGAVLYDQKELPAAIDAYKKGLGIEPKDAVAWNNLGVALYLQKNLPAAIDAYKKALEIEPKNTFAWNGLGATLHLQKDLPAAIEAYHKALAVEPKDAQAWNNLGLALADQKDLPAAIDAFKKALEFDPKYAKAWYDLGVALADQKDLPAAIEAYHKALAIEPKDAQAWYSLGVALHAQKNLSAATDAYKKAVAIDPQYAFAWNNLGAVLHAQEDLPAATDAFKKAVASEPKYANAWNNLGAVLHAQKDLPAAIDAYKNAIKIKPNFPNAHAGLGLALRDRVDFADAVAAFQRALQLLPNGHDWQPVLEGQLKQCQQLLALEHRLPNVLKGEKLSSAEYLALADLCQRYKRYHAAAARLYAIAFTTQPTLADDLAKGHRYNAAFSAVLAAAGQGRDPQKPDDQEKIKLRAQALKWLRADLELSAKQFETGKAETVLLLLQRLPHWQTDPDLASVREPKAVATLPEKEQAEWRKLWADVDKLVKEIRTSITETAFPGTLTAEKRQRIHEMKLTAGKTYIIDLHSAAFDAYLKLLDAKGKLLAENDDIAPDNQNSRIIFTPKEDGTYRIVATSFQEQGTGAYTLTMRAIGGKTK